MKFELCVVAPRRLVRRRNDRDGVLIHRLDKFL